MHGNEVNLTPTGADKTIIDLPPVEKPPGEKPPAEKPPPVVDTPPADSAPGVKPPYFSIVGDSTVAWYGGWGNGFISFLQEPAKGTNDARTGTTTRRFREQGWWDQVINATKERSHDYEPIVMIQFGHNDDKPHEEISLDQFKEYLETMAADVRSAGGTPMIVTPIHPRDFKDGHIVEGFKGRRESGIAAAKAAGAQYVDLNQASANYISAIGEEASIYYAIRPGDTWHLNLTGDKVFGRMMVDLFIQLRPEMEKYFQKPGGVSALIKEGKFATAYE